MPSPATALLQAFNGKSVQSPGANYGGYNPFAGNANAGVTDPGAQAQNEVQTAQDAYQSQQDSAKSQLQANLQPASVGGGSTIFASSPQGNSSAQQPSNPFAQFNDAISGINQRGLDATSQVQQQAANQFAQKLSDLNNQYTQNINSGLNQWDQTQIGAMLGNQLMTPPTGADPNSLGSRAVQLAKQVVANHVPYVWGGNSLTQGVDCSGLVQQVYGRLGIQLPRTSTEQAKFGKIVPSLSQALPGDLILEYSPYEPQGLQQFGHVGIYIGNGQVIEAPGTGKNVRIGPIVNMTRIVRPW